MKRIVLMFDGTGNLPMGGRTNVVRLYRSLGHDAGEQVKYYQPGVGTMVPLGIYSGLSQRLLQYFDLGVAWMLERHVCSAYKFLMAAYEPGDQIFAFGFSRGAYTARVLSGMLARIGLLHRGQEEMVPFAWRVYKQEGDGHHAAGRFKKTFSMAAGIELLGVWDTVSSIGLPWFPSNFFGTRKNDLVKRVRHAVSLDERRVMFVQNLWAPNAPDVLQVAFAGAHSDVGGGYPEKNGDHEASLIPFAWMLKEAVEAGLSVDESEVRKLMGLSNLDPYDPESVSGRYSGGPIHESLKKGWKLFEVLPIPRWRLGDAGYRREWSLHRGRRRNFGGQVQFHKSIELRMKVKAEYRPAIPPGTTFVW